ncbi:MAG: hypothetical protein ACI3Z9_08210 [Candidatus Onthomorpha sp.]
MAKIENVYFEHIFDDSVKYARYRSTFGEIVRKDSGNKKFGFSPRILGMQSLDIDKIEDSRGTDNNSTMDLAIGIADFDDINCTFAKECLLLIELKLNSVTFNLKPSDLCSKDKHTRAMDWNNLSLCQTSVFVFPEKVIGKAKSNLRSWQLGSGGASMKNWVFLSPADFNGYIKFEEDYPYNPITDFGIIDTKIASFVSKEQFEACADYIDKEVRSKLEDFHNHYNKQEVRHIVENLQATSQKLFPNLPDKYEAEYLKLVIKDVITIGEKFAKERRH